MPQLKRLRPKKPAASAAPARWRAADLVAAAVLAALGLAVYSNSFQVPFVLDGQVLLDNFSQHHIWPWQLTYGGNRPVGFLTFGLNYVWGGDHVWGFHAVNVLIHVMAGWLLYAIIRHTLSRPLLAERYAAASFGLALAAAAIWTVHPLQTESVTYLYQRLEALMGLFYLLTLFCFIRAQESARPLAWYAASVVACVLGMGSKEVMITAPLVVLWYDRALVASSWREILRVRGKYYAALASTWVLLAYLTTRGMYASSGLLHVRGVTWLGYALSQPGVILHYLRLCLWPRDLCLYYGWPVAETARQIVPPALTLAALLAITLWCVFQRPALGFLGGWFFLILAPTSSVAPIKDLAFEHRMYLPLAAVVVLAVIAGYEAWRALAHWLYAGRQSQRVLPAPLVPGVMLLLLVAALASRTFERNDDYQSPLVLWEETARTAPGNWGAYTFLGAALYEAGQMERALAELNRAIELKPDFAEAFLNRGAAYLKLGDLDRALADFNHVIELDPGNGAAYYNRAKIYANRSKWKSALQDLSGAIERGVNDAERYYQRAGVYKQLGEYSAAKRDYDEILRIDPQHLLARNARAWLLCTCPDAQVRRKKQALAEASQICELTHGKSPEALETLAAAYAEGGDFEQAVKWETQAIRLKRRDARFTRDAQPRLEQYRAGKPYRDETAKQSEPAEQSE